MARLNEPPQPATESLDALKRRFVRQNREIAKVNSNQSLRIRSLETEVSRLLGENVSLREQIIKLHYELESNAGKPDTSTIDAFRIRLEAKLKEVGNLVQELGDVQKAAKKRSQQKRRSMDSRLSPKRSPNQRSWKNTQTLSDLMGEAEGRLPPILEDKQFPRRTLDLDELHGLLAAPANLTDSPDIGPPPIAHFEEGEAIAFEKRSGRRTSSDNSQLAEPSQPPSKTKLEARRKRRESIHSKDTAFEEFSNSTSKESIVTQGPTDSKGQSIKAGAKRKWNGKDENAQHLKEVEKSGEGTTGPMDEKISRSTANKVSERPPSRVDRAKEARGENSSVINASNRRVLGPKSANMSPAKSKIFDAKDKLIPTKETLLQRIKDRDNQKEKIRAKTPVEEYKPAIETTKPKKLDLSVSSEPETPAPPLDLFSPTSTEPSARQEGRGDTPPPPDLGPDTGTGSFGRSSRRSRGSVSYAEPNLRDKMRRPTKELVDAVGAEERARQAQAIKAENIESALASMKIKDEAVHTTVDASSNVISNWKGMPLEESHAQKRRQKSESTSPLSQKAQQQQNSDLPSSVTAERRRRTSILPRTATDSTEPNSPVSSKTSGAASTIAALAKPTAKRRQEGMVGLDLSEPAKDLTLQGFTNIERNSSGSIFDFTGSSPDAKKTLEREDDPVAAASSTSRTARSARRHSSVPALSEHGRGSLAISRRSRRESMA